MDEYNFEMFLLSGNPVKSGFNFKIFKWTGKYENAKYTFLYTLPVVILP